MLDRPFALVGLHVGLAVDGSANICKRVELKTILLYFTPLSRSIAILRISRFYAMLYLVATPIARPCFFILFNHIL